MKNDKNKPAESIPLEEVAEHVHAVLHAVETGNGIDEGVKSLAWLYEKFGEPWSRTARNFGILCVCFGADVCEIVSTLAPRGTFPIPSIKRKNACRGSIIEQIAGEKRTQGFVKALKWLRKESPFPDWRDESSTISVPVCTGTLSAWQMFDQEKKRSEDLISIFNAFIRLKEAGNECSFKKVALASRLSDKHLRYLFPNKYFFRLLTAKEARWRLANEEDALARWLECKPAPSKRKGINKNRDWRFLFPFPLRLYVKKLCEYFLRGNENLRAELTEKLFREKRI